MILDPFWAPFAAKIVATMAVVMTAALVAERVGPFLGALVACLPVSAGPAYVLLALQHDAAFLGESALASAVTVAATVAFLAVYVFLAPRTSLPAALAAGLGAWFAGVLLLRPFPWTAWTALALNVAVFAAAIPMTRSALHVAQAPRLGRRWYDLPRTAAIVGLLVGSVVTLSTTLGPAFTGIAALAPVTFSSLVLVVHSRLGGAVAAATMASATRAMPGMCLGLLLLHALAVPAGVALALAAALAAILAWSSGLLLWRWRASRLVR